MRMLHLADLHLGKRVNGFELLDDQTFLLENVLALCETHKVDTIALAGDIYDTTMPPAGAVTLFDHFLTQCANRKLRVLAISGNHDSAERLDYGSSLFSQAGIHIAGRFTGQINCVTLPDEYGTVDCYLLPFVRSSTVVHYLPDAPITDYTSAVAAALATAPVDATHRSILLAHQFVTAEGAMPDPSGSETARINVGTVDNVGGGCMDGYDYVALGHIHRPQQVGRPGMRYAGSPLCYSLDECGMEKSAVLVTLEEKGKVETQLLPLAPKRAMRHITGPMQRLTAPATVCDAEDYIWATLTDETPVPDAMARLRAAYPNAMKLDYATGQTAGTELVQATQIRNKTFEELFGDFFEKMQGRPLNDAEAAELASLREEVLK